MLSLYATSPSDFLTVTQIPVVSQNPSSISQLHTSFLLLWCCSLPPTFKSQCLQPKLQICVVEELVSFFWSLLFIVYCCTENDVCLICGLIPNIEALISPDLRCQITVLGDFNLHNEDWLKHLSTTSTMGPAAEVFVVINSLLQLVSLPTHTPTRLGERVRTLGLVLISISCSLISLHPCPHANIQFWTHSAY